MNELKREALERIEMNMAKMSDIKATYILGYAEGMASASFDSEIKGKEGSADKKEDENVPA